MRVAPSHIALRQPFLTITSVGRFGTRAEAPAAIAIARPKGYIGNLTTGPATAHQRGGWFFARKCVLPLQIDCRSEAGYRSERHWTLNLRCCSLSDSHTAQP